MVLSHVLVGILLSSSDNLRAVELLATSGNRREHSTRKIKWVMVRVVATVHIMASKSNEIIKSKNANLFLGFISHCVFSVKVMYEELSQLMCLQQFTPDRSRMHAIGRLTPWIDRIC